MIRHLRDVTGLLPQPVRRELRRVIYSGGSERCPICGSSLRRWIGHGGGEPIYDARRVVGGMRREEDSCPICHGKDRTRLIQLCLETEIGVGRRPLRLLDVAPEYGLYLWLKGRPGLDYMGCDLDASRYRHIRPFTAADLTRLPFEDGRFDVIVCSHVLEHVPDDAQAMREMRRVLAPGGAALLLTPEATDGGPTDEDPSVVDPAERRRRFGQWDHVRLYAREDFTARLTAAGFHVDLYNPAADDPSLASRRRLNPAERLRIARPPMTGSN